MPGQRPNLLKTCTLLGLGDAPEVEMDDQVDVEADEAIILVVDDDEPTRQLFTTALARAGFVTRAAGDGRDALDIVSDEPIAVVLLDGHMPGMSGLEVLAELRSSPGGATLPVIFVTGQDQLDDRIRGLEAGANDYLTKPVELRELVTRVRAQLRAKAAWGTTVDDLEQRLDAVMLLRRIRRAETAELTAGEVCAELTRLAGIDGAAVLVVRGARSVVPLAVHGALEGELAPGTPLGEAVAPQVASRLQRGPWIEHSESHMGFRDSGVFALATIERLAVAPLDGRHSPLGALLLAGNRGASASPGVLSAAIDFAAVVSTLIAPDLERQEALDASRSALSRVVSTGAFDPHYQPVIDLTSNVVVGYEGLTRWSDGTRPDIRFAEAKALGMGVEVERATLQALVADANGFDATLWLSLNVSADLILSGTLHDLVATQNQPIVLELTEHEPIEDYPRVQHAVRAIPDVRLAVDDAGAGYASMRHILDLRPDFVKLDITWVRGLDTDGARQALTVGMVGFAAELGCTLIAEGVETEAERATLEHLGVTLGQGYLLGRPAPADQW